MSTIDLPALQSQLASLERQKTLLTTQLLTLRASRPLSTNTAPPPTTKTPTATTPTPTPKQDPLTDAQLLTHVFASSTTAQSAAIARLHRITGITTFAVRDPSPPHEKLLGIRIEVFADRKFLTPHYILLSFPPATTNGKAPPFTIHRHTLPPFLPLPRPTRTLPAYVRSLRRLLLLHARRVSAVSALRKRALSAGRVGDVTEEWTNRVEDIEWDAGVGVVTVTWRNGTKGWVRVGEEGVVGKVVVKDGKERREAEVERRITGGLEGMARRMGWGEQKEGREEL